MNAEVRAKVTVIVLSPELKVCSKTDVELPNGPNVTKISLCNDNLSF